MIISVFSSVTYTLAFAYVYIIELIHNKLAMYIYTYPIHLTNKLLRLEGVVLY